MTEEHFTINTRSKLARGIDSFSLRVTFFLMVLIAVNQFINNFYICVILASFGTAFLNRQINAFKQRRLTKLAKEKSLQPSEQEGREVETGEVGANQALSFLLSGLFLMGLALFFEGWFKYYFFAFSIFNLALAGFYVLRRTNFVRVGKK